MMNICNSVTKSVKLIINFFDTEPRLMSNRTAQKLRNIKNQKNTVMTFDEFFETVLTTYINGRFHHTVWYKGHVYRIRTRDAKPETIYKIYRQLIEKLNEDLKVS